MTNSDVSTFILPLFYLINSHFSNLQKNLASRPRLRKIFSIILAAGVAPLFIFKLLNKVYGKRLKSRLLHWTTAKANVKANDGLAWAFHHYLETLPKPMERANTFSTLASHKSGFRDNGFDLEQLIVGRDRDMIRKGFPVSRWIRHKGRFFHIGSSHTTENGHDILIQCLGWSTAPNQELLDDA